MKDILQLVAVAAVLVAGFRVPTDLWGFCQRVFGCASRDGRGDSSRSSDQAATVGSRLRPSDRVITGQSGRIELSMGQDAELTLEGGSALELVGATADGLVVELEEGRVQAVVRPGGTQLAVRTGEREVLAEDASFVVGLGEAGQAAVESRQGRVTLVGYGELDAFRTSLVFRRV